MPESNVTSNPNAGAEHAPLKRPVLSGGASFITSDYAASVLPRRELGTHKWEVGGVVIIGGTPNYAGAVALSARGAGRSGAGIVSLAVPRPLVVVLAGAVPEATFVPLPETESLNGARRALDDIRERAERSRALVIGPGLGDDEGATGLLMALFGVDRSAGAAYASSLGFAVSSKSSPVSATAKHGTGLSGLPDLPMVVDADALNWLAKQDNWPDLLPTGRCVLTPHPGEMARLLDASLEEMIADPIRTASDAAKRWKQTVVFKYGYTVVASPDRVLVAEDAPVALATAGSGDVLAGSIGAFLAQGLEPIDAAALAVYAGMRAARQVQGRFGSLGVIATDLPDAIAGELAAIEQGAPDHG